MNLYLYAIREHADEKRLAEIERALEPPVASRVNGRPAWYGDDEEVWQAWELTSRRPTAR